MRQESVSAAGRCVRIAWLLPILERGYCWQPLFHEFSKLFPNTTIFTSYWQGTMVVLEAMACGKAVLCSKYAGAKELVQSQSNGFVFDPYDPSKLAGYMERFVRQPDLIANFGARSKEIIAPYTPARAAQALAAVANGLLAPPLPTEPRVETA